MTTKKDILIRELKTVEKTFGRCVAIEIGTIRNTSDEHAKGDGHSTLHIAEYIKESGADIDFYSVDIRISVAEKYMAEKGLSDYVTFQKADGLVFLTSWEKAHFIYLDGENDAKDCLKQFIMSLSKIQPGGVIIVDDCYPHSQEIVKAQDVLYYLTEMNRSYMIENNMLIYYA